MDNAKKGIIKNKIIASIESIKGSIEELEAVTKPISPDRAIGRISRMDAIQNKSVSESSLVAARERLEKLENALNNIDKSDFGVCEVCEKEIMPIRLFEVPEATTCVNCG